MSTPAFTQIEPTPWPSGRGEAIATTRVRPELLSRAFGLSFEESDVLRSREAAAIRMRSGRMLGLVRQRSGSRSGTELNADSADRFMDALTEFLDAFDLSVQDLSWIRDDLRASTAG